MFALTRRRLGEIFGATIVATSVSGKAAGSTGGIMSTDETALQVPAQSIPVPKSVSPQAQAFLAATAKRINAMQKAGGAAHQEPLDQQVASALQFLAPLAKGFKGTSDTIELPYGVKLYRMTPEGRAGRRADIAYYDIHGGGFVGGGGDLCRVLATIRAMDYGVEVFSVDYRLAPEHVFPAALDDCVAAYREVLKYYKPQDLIVGGASAGGNLAAALMLRASHEGLPLPVALVLQTPAADLTGTGDSRHTNRFLDPTLYGGSDSGPSAYAAKEDPKNPFVSPVFGDLTKGWPQTILTSGTRDLLLSDTVCMHRALRRAGVKAELHVTEASGHTGFMGANAPEDGEILAECRRFCFAAWGLS
jgi:acetyl esterase/lipase